MTSSPHRPAAVLLVVGAALSAAAPCSAAAAHEIDPVPGELIVMPAAHATPLDPLGPVPTAWRGRPVLDHDPIGGALLLAIPAGTERDAAIRWSARADVQFAEPNGRGTGGAAGDPDGAGVPPDDTFFDRQWHLLNTGQSGGTPGADVDALGAWALSDGDPNVVIAVLDSGMNLGHLDFVGRVLPDGFDHVNEDADPSDDHGHGSQVAGVIAANRGNRFAVSGVDPSVTILPVKVLNQANAGTTFDLVQGINFAAGRPDVDIISMSLIDYPAAASLAGALQDARDAGKILIACAGNGGIGNADVSWPGASPLTISIGATTRADARAGFSGTGAALDFTAPGLSIATVVWDSDRDDFQSVAGCSFATPLTAGIVSMMVAEAADAGVALTHDEVRALLVQAARDGVGPPQEDTPGRDDFFGHGRLDARLAIEATLAFVAGTACPADLDGSSDVGFADLLTLLACFGDPSPACGALDLVGGDGLIGFEDVLTLLAAWGPCRD